MSEKLLQQSETEKFPPQSAKFCVWDFSEFNFATSKGLRKQL